MKFRMLLPTGSAGDYTFHTITAPDFVFNARKENFYTEQKGDTAFFQFNTGSGIETLVFSITHKKTKKVMSVTILNMFHDITYFIDLTTFTPGHFLFDWRQINQCQKEHKTKVLVNCKGQKFYQLELVDEKSTTWPKGFVHNSIKPFKLSFFRKPG
ncbi:hypothetical protein DBR32_08835 [Taibaiella sp. KBW10]|nr:hypothetical protein DBR32_08835 [Taibaiella sp. KBW10]